LKVCVGGPEYLVDFCQTLVCKIYMTFCRKYTSAFYGSFFQISLFQQWLSSAWTFTGWKCQKMSRYHRKQHHEHFYNWKYNTHLCLFVCLIIAVSLLGLSASITLSEHVCLVPFAVPLHLLCLHLSLKKHDEPYLYHSPLLLLLLCIVISPVFSVLVSVSMKSTRSIFQIW
jgi:hypothetical protein